MDRGSSASSPAVATSRLYMSGQMQERTLWFHSPTKWDARNLYLVSSSVDMTADVQVW